MVTMGPEGKVKETIKTILHKHHVYYFMPHGGPYGNIGVPDFVCCFEGKFLAIEAKSKKGVLSERQKMHINDIKNHEGTAFVINEDNINELEQWLMK